MFSRRNLLGSLAFIPSCFFLKPALSNETSTFTGEWDLDGKRLILLPNHCHLYEYKNGRKEYFFCDLKHREDGPAVEYFVEGESRICRKEWWFKGKRHRIGGPAIDESRIQEWWVDGQLHRLDGPAMTRPFGYEAWAKNGKWHREGGPAVTWANKAAEYWYRDGDIHREDGPAVIHYGHKRKDWYLNGRCYRIECNGVEMPI